MLPRLDSTSLPFVFTPKFMRTFTNNLSSQKNFLHKAAKLIALEMSDIAKTNREIGFQIILQLSGKNGVQQFDKVTNSKTVESIAANMDVAGVQNYIDHLLLNFDNSFKVYDHKTSIFTI